MQFDFVFVFCCLLHSAFNARILDKFWRVLWLYCLGGDLLYVSVNVRDIIRQSPYSETSETWSLHRNPKFLQNLLLFESISSKQGWTKLSVQVLTKLKVLKSLRKLRLYSVLRPKHITANGLWSTGGSFSSFSGANEF